MSAEIKRTKSLESYQALLEKSGLLDGDKLARLVDEFQDSAPAEKLSDGRAFGRFLVERDVITDWHHQNLVKGTYKGFELGKYRLLKPLGVGGMGTVFLAQHKLMKRLVAIKALPKSMVNQRSYLERFHREVQLVASLDHPNIVQAYSADNEGDQHYLVMEYVDGEDLQELVDANGPVAIDDAVRYIAQAADGLAHAHDAKVVHRDIKPANLLIDKQGTVKILDMGLARLGDEDHSITREHDERLIGTTDYMAPEQALDSHTVDARADIYSLGCTLYFALTGHAPFPTGTVAEKLLKHHKEEPQSILTDRPDCPPAVVAVCGRMMAKRPDDRYQNASELRDALQTIAEGGTPETAEVADDAAGFALDVESADDKTADVAAPEQSSRQMALWIATGVAALVVLCFFTFLMLGNSNRASVADEQDQAGPVARQPAASTPRDELPKTAPEPAARNVPPPLAQADDGRFAFVEAGAPVAVREQGTPWKRERGYVESVGPRDLLYAAKPVTGDFHVRARLSVQVVDKLPPDAGPSFILDDNLFGFANLNDQLFVHWDGRKAPIGKTSDHIQAGMPFDFEAVRGGGKLLFRINGREVWNIDDTRTDPVTICFKPSVSVMRVYEFASTGTADVDPQVAVVPDVAGTNAPVAPRPREVTAAIVSRWQADWQMRRNAPDARFHQLSVVNVEGPKDTTFEVGADGIIVVGGKSEEKADYTITATTGLREITGFRLEVLAIDGKGPGREGNGNFVLNRFDVFASDTADFPPRGKLRLVGAYADHSQGGFPVQNTINGCVKTGWAILPEAGKDHWAIFTLDKPLVSSGTRHLKFVVSQQFGAKHTFGRFRLTAMSGQPRPVPPPEVATVLKTPGAKRTPEQKQTLESYITGGAGRWLGNTATGPKQDTATKLFCVYANHPIPDHGRIDQFRIETQANNGWKCRFFLLRPQDDGKWSVIAEHEISADGAKGSRTVVLPAAWQVQRGDLIAHLGRGGPAYQGGFRHSDTWYHPVPAVPVAGQVYDLPDEMRKHDRLYGLEYHFVPNVETSFPKQAEPPAPLPFGEFAAGVDLPEIGTKEQPAEGWEKVVLLGHVHLSSPADPLDEMTLIGGDLVDEGDKFVVNPETRTPQGQVWRFGYQSKKEAAIPVARCGFAGGNFYWQWLPAALEERRAQQLRNCLLRLKAGGQTHVLALRTPVMSEALTLDLTRSLSRQVDLDWAPRAELVRLELTFQSDTFKPAFKPEGPFEAKQGVINAVHGTTPEDQVLAFKINHRFNRRFKLRLEPYFFALAMGQWTELDQTNTNLAVARNNTAAALAKKLTDEANRVRDAGLKKKAQEAAKAEQAKVDISKKQIETLQQLVSSVHLRGSLQFRLYCVYGEHQLDLVRSKPAELPAEATEGAPQ